MKYFISKTTIIFSLMIIVLIINGCGENYSDDKSIINAKVVPISHSLVNMGSEPGGNGIALLIDETNVPMSEPGGNGSIFAINYYGEISYNTAENLNPDCYTYNTEYYLVLEGAPGSSDLYYSWKFINLCTGEMKINNTVSEDGSFVIEIPAGRGQYILVLPYLN